MADRAPGMDHAHYAFRKLPGALPFDWPGGARIALTVTLMLDAWEIRPLEGAIRDPRIVSPPGTFFPDWLTWSQRQYGARVGIFRVLNVLDAFGLTPSVALSAGAAVRYPELIDELLCRRACFMAHGTYATRRITERMPEAEEKAQIVAGRDAPCAAQPAWHQPAGAARTSMNRRAHRRCSPRPASPTPPIGPTTTAPICLAATMTTRSLHCRRNQSGTTSSLWCCVVSRRPCGPTASPMRSPFCTTKAAAYPIWRSLGRGRIWRTTTDELAEAARSQLV